MKLTIQNTEPDRPDERPTEIKIHIGNSTEPHGVIAGGDTDQHELLLPDSVTLRISRDYVLSDWTGCGRAPEVGQAIAKAAKSSKA